jgi:glutathione reductase (NADPH)
MCHIVASRSDLSHNTMDFDFDLITLGAGSGGVAASRRAALHGARVAVVENSRVGGTCVIRGCVPKKLLMYAAQFGDAMKEAQGYGWNLGTAPQFQMPVWAAAKAAEINRLEGIYRQMLAGSRIQLIEGRARIEGAHTVAVGEQRLTARHILIATGAAPVRDSIPGIEDCAISDDLLDLQDLPAQAAVIGGGYIAVEFASMLARLGVKVELFYRANLPLRGFDDSLRSHAAAALQAAGIVLHSGSVPRSVQRLDDGRFLLLLGEERVREFPWVLNATGRRPNTAGLGLETLGIVPDAQGAVPVDAHSATTAAGVWAIGDVTNGKNLTPVAIAEGRALADTLFGPTPRSVDLSRVASAVFMLPPVASIGPGEAEALAAGHRVKVFETEFRPMKQTFIGGSERSYMKLLVDADDDRVLAVHMLGADAPEIVQSLAVALTAGATKADFDRTIAVHPTAAEEFVLMREPARLLEAAAPGPIS